MCSIVQNYIRFSCLNQMEDKCVSVPVCAVKNLWTGGLQCGWYLEQRAG